MEGWPWMGDKEGLISGYNNERESWGIESIDMGTT